MSQEVKFDQHAADKPSKIWILRIHSYYHPGHVCRQRTSCPILFSSWELGISYLEKSIPNFSQGDYLQELQEKGEFTFRGRSGYYQSTIFETHTFHFKQVQIDATPDLNFHHLIPCKD